MAKKKENLSFTAEELDNMQDQIEKVTRSLQSSGNALSESEAIALLQDIKENRTHAFDLFNKVNLNSLSEWINEFRKRMGTNRNRKKAYEQPAYKKRKKYVIGDMLPATERLMIAESESIAKQIKRERGIRRQINEQIRSGETTGEIDGKEMSEKDTKEILEFLNNKLDGFNGNEMAIQLYLRKFFETFPNENIDNFCEEIMDIETNEVYIKLIRQKALALRAERRNKREPDPNERKTTPVFPTSRNRNF